MQPVLFGLSGPELTERERSFFREREPAGFILFKRNCIEPGQVRALTDALRALTDRQRLPILIDQEGGRVARLGPPHWPSFPAAARFGALYGVAPLTAIEAAQYNGQALAAMLLSLGITVDCLPVLDVPDPDGHEIIGDRAYSSRGLGVAALGSATLAGLRAGGVVGVVKHMPGHGRARADSHLELPVVGATRKALERDLQPFRALADAPMAMTAHVVYTAFDPERCASLSPVVIGEVVRRVIGFDGLLLSDDIGMHALQGAMGERARGVLDAGCDLALHCSGDFAEMQAVSDAVPAVSPAALARMERAMAWPMLGGEPADGEAERLAARRDQLLAMV